MNLHQKPDWVPSVPSTVPGTRKMHWTRQISTWGLVAAVSVVAITENAIAKGLNHQATPAEVPSLFDPEQAKAHPMTQEQRWQLDFELANEIGMMDHNSWRFMPPNSFEKRARWYEETAKYYRIADLLQQIVDFRRSAMRNNERALNELYEMGRSGDISAVCFAAMLYGNHKPEATKGWKLSYDEILRLGVKHHDSGHKVCRVLLASVHAGGLLGYARSEERAKPWVIQSAVDGFYLSQYYMALTHLEGTGRLKPADFGAYMCWTRVTYQQSPISSFPLTCESQLAGTVLDHNIKRVPITDELLQITRRWCDPQAVVTAQTCADLELQTNRSRR